MRGTEDRTKGRAIGEVYPGVDCERLMMTIH